MRAWAYTAYTGAGRRRTGTVVAETEARAAEELKRRGLFVSDLADRGARRAGRAAGRGVPSGLLPGGRRGGGRLGADQQAVLTRQLAVLLGAELPGDAALEAVRASGGGSAMDTVAARARAALLEGQPMSEALAGSGAGLPPYYLAAVRAGERSGDLAAVFAALADHLEASGSERAEIASALVYPAFVAAVSLLVCGILMTSVAPQIAQMFALSDRPLPPVTRAVMAVSDLVLGHLPLIGAAALALALLAGLTGRIARLAAARDRVLLRLPLAGRLMRQAAAMQYLRTLALVLGSRHAVLSATESAAEVLTVARFRAEAEDVSVAVRGGESLAQALRRLSFIPPVARQLVEAGEMSARLARMTGRAAVLVETGLRADRRRIAALLEPALMMLVGALVLTIVLAVLLPIFDLQAIVAG